MRRTAALVTALLAGCGAAAPHAEVGVGTRTFEALPADGAVVVVCGPQGGQHIWTSVRSQGVGPDHTALLVEITDPATGERICGQELSDLLLESQGDWDAFSGLACFIPDPAKVDGRTLRLHGRVTDAAGHTAEASRTVVPSGPGRNCRL